MVVPGVVVKNIVTTLELGQSRVVLAFSVSGWKIYVDNKTTFVGATWLVMDESSGSKNTLLEFMDLSGINYKFMDPKMHFQNLWTYVFKVYRPKWHKLQVNRPKNALLEFVDLNNTPLRVGGPLVNFILFLKWMHPQEWWPSLSVLGGSKDDPSKY